ncbi:hypothetical protein A0V01_05115 (plasmid) [Borrelia hermsii]|uniref:Uncharacterized protein n=1 Tax=Borrelia hermsii TaxID=140 RepID=A0AAN0X6J1_BORHE|nr:hypothetical protein [Borrelia hermsii]AMR75995.1 hypothetical protein A0V01_05115 [Borrelia hermsii]UPA08593.1 hypothetical protein bhDAH_001306 [Borrelia hermsii DAH]
MAKKRHHNFLLLLLVISCNLKPKEDALLKRSLIVKTPLQVIRGPLVGNVGGAILPLKKHEEEDSDKDELDELDGSMKDRINKLKDKFGTFPKGEKVFRRIRTIVTSPDIPGAKTYTTAEFCSFLESLNDASINGIVEPLREILEVKDDILRVMGDIKAKESIKNLIDEFNLKDKEYGEALKGAFNNPKIEDVLVGMRDSVSKYKAEFTKIKADVEKVLELEKALIYEQVVEKGEKIYDRLSGNERAVIEYMRDALTDPSIETSGDRAYTDDEFYHFLGSLSDVDIRNFTAHMKLKEQDEALRAIEIEDVKTESLRATLKAELELKAKECKSVLRRLCRKPIDKERGNIIIEGFNKYEAGIARIKTTAEEFVRFENLYASLPDDKRAVIEYIRSVVTDPGIGSDKGYKTYSDPEFDLLLVKLGINKIETVISYHLTVASEKAATKAIIDGVRGGTLRGEFEGRFDLNCQEYELALKGKFSTPELLGLSFESKYVEEFIKIKADAEKAIRGENLYLSLQDNEREVVDYMQSVMFDPSIRGHLIKSTCTELKFYHLLSNWDIVRLREIIGIHLDILKLQEQTLNTIGNIKRKASKRDWQHDFDNAKYTYLCALKDSLIGPGPLRDYSGFKKFDFDDIIFDAESVIKYENLYAALSDEELGAIEHIRSVVTDPNIRDSEGNAYSEDYTYTEFEGFLDALDVIKVRDIARVYLDICSARDDALRAIGNVTREDSKQELKRKFDDYNKIYLSDMKFFIIDSDSDSMYEKIMDVNYKSRHVDAFNAIKNEAISLP